MKANAIHICQPDTTTIRQNISTSGNLWIDFEDSFFVFHKIWQILFIKFLVYLKLVIEDLKLVTNRNIRNLLALKLFTQQFVVKFANLAKRIIICDNSTTNEKNLIITSVDEGQVELVCCNLLSVKNTRS